MIVGSCDGMSVECTVGSEVGESDVGDMLGGIVGASVGSMVGSNEGIVDGRKVGFDVGLFVLTKKRRFRLTHEIY